MTIRRINYTGRKRLSQQDVRVYLSASDARPVQFDAEIDVTEYDLPQESLISIEAYRQTSWMRFDCGTVAQIAIPKDRVLTEFDSPEGILFRLRVTSPKGPDGLLLAEVDRIRPRIPEDTDENRLSLLPVKPEDLGEQLFRVDFSDGPILQVNSRSGDWRSLARDPIFIAFAFPSAFREILTRIILVDKYYDLEDMADWRAQWLKFSTALPGVTVVTSGNDVEYYDDWIDDAVTAFCRYHGSFKQFASNYWVKGDRNETA
jgi:hypothetical protein